MSKSNIKQEPSSQTASQEPTNLEHLLSNKNLPLLQLLSIKNIQPKIRSNLTYFIKHCQKNQQFCFGLIDIGIKCPMHQGSNQTMKNACYIASDVLTSDQNIIADLLILPDKSKPKKNDSDNQSEEFQEIEQNIQNETQTHAGPSQHELLQQSLSDQDKFQKRCKYLTRVIEYITLNQVKNLDQNCINYMIKSLNCLVRRKAPQFIDFLQKKPEVLRKLIELNDFSSVNQLLIKIISDDQIQGENIDSLKKKIMTQALQIIKSSIHEQNFTERLQFLQELFQTNRYASDDDRTNLQKLSDIFSSQQTIAYFYNVFMNPTNITDFYNATSYLISIFKRMNVDEQSDSYSYNNEKKQQTMVFEVDFMYRQFQAILTKGYENITKFQHKDLYVQKLIQTKFYELLILMAKNSRFRNCFNEKGKEDVCLKGNNIIFKNKGEKILTLKELIKQFCNQSRNGLNRLSLISLIQKVINMQIYQDLNHFKSQKKITLSQDKQTQQNIKNQEQTTTQKTQSLKASQQSTSQPQTSAQEQQSSNPDEKKKKINKIKAGLKLNIKKFSLDITEPQQKPQPQPQVQQKPNVQQIQSLLQLQQIIEILELFVEQLKNHIEFNQAQFVKRQKNNQTQIGALINKVVMILCNAVRWEAQLSSDTLISQKDKFIQTIQKMFPFFDFDHICKNYSVYLATTKHPNIYTKQRTNAQLNFVFGFVKTYHNPKETQEEKPKQPNKQLYDSDFLSDENQEDTSTAVKCTLEDLKKITGFKFQSKNVNEKLNTSPKQPIKNQEPQVIKVLQQPKIQQKPIDSQQKRTNDIKKELQAEHHQKNTGSENTEKISAQTNSIEKPLKQALAQQKNDTVKTQKIPIEFYVKHPMIFV